MIVFCEMESTDNAGNSVSNGEVVGAVETTSMVSSNGAPPISSEPGNSSTPNVSAPTVETQEAASGEPPAPPSSKDPIDTDATKEAESMEAGKVDAPDDDDEEEQEKTPAQPTVVSDEGANGAAEDTATSDHVQVSKTDDEEASAAATAVSEVDEAAVRTERKRNASFIVDGPREVFVKQGPARKIMKLTPGINKLSAESAQLIGQSSQTFLVSLMNRAKELATDENGKRHKLQYKHVAGASAQWNAAAGFSKDASS